MRTRRYDMVMLGGGTGGLVDSVGLGPIEPEIDFGAVMDHVRAMRALAPHDSPERLERTGVKVIIGHGRFVGPGRIAVGERELSCRTAVIATASRPILPAGPGLADALTTDTIWDSRECPQ